MSFDRVTVQIPDDYVSAKQFKKVIPEPVRESSTTHKSDKIDADKIGEIALSNARKAVLNAPDKTKNTTLLKQGILLGGHIKPGFISYNAAYDTLKAAINERECDDYENAYDTIEDGLKYGMERPFDRDALLKRREQWLEENYQKWKEQHKQSNGQHSENGQQSNQKNEQTDTLKALLLARQKLFEAKNKKVVFASPIIKREEVGIIYPNTINVIQAKDGMHKSRLAGIIVSCLLKVSGCTNKHLGFTADAFRSYTGLYVDTERNLKDQLPYALQQIQLQAGYSLEDNPRNFDFISLLEFERELRLTILSEYLEYARKQYSNHIFIVLDVVTDCLSDFNNVKDSLKLIDLMNRLINTYDVTFLCIIHENPNSEKARGNIGTEIINKATTALQLDFVKDASGESTDVIKVKYRKARMSAKPAPFYMRYDAQESLVLADPEFREPSKELCPIPELIDFLEKQLLETKLKDEVFTAAREYFKCKDRTLEDRIKKIMDEEHILYNKDGKESILHRGKQGKQASFELKPIEEDEN